MPDDDQLSDDLIVRYDEVRKTLAQQIDPRAVPLLLNSFGDGNGFGVYQLVEDTLRAYPREQVVQALMHSLRSDISSVRSWSMDIALEYSDERLLPHAVHLLNSADRDTRFFAAAFLAEFADPPASVREALQRGLGRESDSEIQQVIRDGLSR